MSKLSNNDLTCSASFDPGLLRASLERESRDERNAASLSSRATRSECDAADQRALVECNLSLVKATVSRMRIHLPATLDLEDLYSVGFTGLVAAARNYDPLATGSFAAFAVAHIRGAVLDELRRMDWMPRTVRDKARHFRDEVADLEQKLGRTATEEEICARLDLTPDRLDALIEEIKPASYVPLDGEAYSEEADSIRVHEMIEDEQQETAFAQIDRKDLLQLMAARIEQLPDMQKKVLAMYYFEEFRVAEIAASFGVSEGRISQIHTQAVLSLRGFLTRRIAYGVPA